MDVGNVKGPGGIDRNQPRHERAGGSGSVPTGGLRADKASISEAGRDHLATLKELTARAREEEPTRREKVAEAEGRLRSGDLDRDEVFHDTADEILRGDGGLPGF